MSKLGNRFHQFSRWLSLFFLPSLLLQQSDSVSFGASLSCTVLNSQQVVGGLANFGEHSHKCLCLRYPFPSLHCPFRNSRIIWSIWSISAWPRRSLTALWASNVHNGVLLSFSSVEGFASTPLLFSLLSNQLLSCEFLFYEHLARQKRARDKCVLDKEMTGPKYDCSDKGKKGR